MIFEYYVCGIIEYWSIYGAIVFALSCIFVKSFPGWFIRPFVVVCGPVAWLMMAWRSIGEIKRLNDSRRL